MRTTETIKMDKQREVNLTLFNEHQANLRDRANSLAKSIFLLAGGALTISFGVILRDNAPSVSESVWKIISFSWGALSTSIISAVLYLSFMILRDSRGGEKWRANIRDEGPSYNGGPDSLERLILALFWISVISLIIGIITLFLAGSKLVNVT